MPESPPDLAALLARPPEGVAVMRGLDRVAIRPRRGALEPPSLAIPVESLWFYRFFPAFYAITWGLIAGAQLGSGESLSSAMSAALLLFLPATGVLLLPLYLLTLAVRAIRRARQALRSLRPWQVSLTAQGFRVEHAGQESSFDLDSIRIISISSPDGDPTASALWVKAGGRWHSLLDGILPTHQAWLRAALQAAVAQRKAALIAAGHDLSRPPPEADALRAVAQRVGDPARK